MIQRFFYCRNFQKTILAQRPYFRFKPFLYLSHKVIPKIHKNVLEVNYGANKPISEWWINKKSTPKNHTTRFRWSWLRGCVDFFRIAFSVKWITSIFKKQKKFLLTTALLPWLWFLSKRLTSFSIKKYKKFLLTTALSHPRQCGEKGYSAPWPFKKLSCHLL